MNAQPRNLLRRLARPPSLWEPIGLAGSQQIIDVQLDEGGVVRDVTQDHVVCSLQPLWVAVSGAASGRARLRFVDRASRRELGELRLRRERLIEAAGLPVTVFAVTGGSHACLSAPLRRWYGLLRSLRGRHGRDFAMSQAAIEQLNIFYLCPRPVVLVSVDDGTASNLFPMDLIGPMSGIGFSLALRKTSPSVATLRAARRVALADVPATQRDLAYRLGERHRAQRIDWSSVPTPLRRSPHFGLQVPAGALRIRECEIDQVLDSGSHDWFLCRVAHEVMANAGTQLFHTSGIHREFRERARRLPWSLTGELPCS